VLHNSIIVSLSHLGYPDWEVLAPYEKASTLSHHYDVEVPDKPQQKCNLSRYNLVQMLNIT
jgi:hypothetical protein